MAGVCCCQYQQMVNTVLDVRYTKYLQVPSIKKYWGFSVSINILTDKHGAFFY